MEPNTYYLQALQGEMERRCRGNPRYSLRAFARAMEIDPGAVSRVLSRKVHPSPPLAKKMLRALDLAPADEKRFWRSLAEARQSKAFPELAAAEPFPASEARALDNDAFRAIADWYHYAILELTFTASAKTDPRWIAAQLGISALEAKLAVERLLKLGLLRKDGRKLRKTDQTLDTANQHLTTPALRRRQKQILEKAIVALEEVPIEVRSHTAYTMAIDPRRLPEAKRRIAAFRDELSVFLEGGHRVRVYELSLALFPLQKKGSRKNEN